MMSIASRQGVESNGESDASFHGEETRLFRDR
jgi:hypothetical protein